MAITDLNGIAAGFGQGCQSLLITKATVNGQLAGGFSSLWRATGIPSQAAIPTTPAVCTGALLGAMGVTNATGGQTNYLGRVFAISSVAGTDLQFHDRLAHMGGLVANVTTAQTVALSLTGVASDRVGPSDASDVQWWLECYSDTGATASNATVNVTYDDDSTGNLAVVAVGGTLRSGRMLQLVSAVPGRKIKAINTVTLSASTGTAGSLGFTATRALCGVSLATANSGQVSDWAMLGMPILPDDVCLSMIVMPGTTATGVVYGTGKVIAG